MIDRDEIARALVAQSDRGGGWICAHVPSGRWVALGACYADPGGEFISILATGEAVSLDSPGDRLSRAHALVDDALEGYESRADFRQWLESQEVGL